MRDIKFRFFHNNKMYYPTLIGLMSELDNDPAIYINIDGNVPHYNDGELMQYTGLLDRKGKEIYEGDIVTDGVFDYVIEFYGGGWCARLCAESGSYQALYHIAKQRTVIGNIHENPELLRGKE